jgi:uncharacterized membrane protein
MNWEPEREPAELGVAFAALLTALLLWALTLRCWNSGSEVWMIAGSLLGFVAFAASIAGAFELGRYIQDRRAR